MVFSTNQVRQFYVVTKAGEIKRKADGGDRTPGLTELKAFDSWGQHELPSNPDTFEFLYVNAHGDLGHSDLIHRENIRKVKFTEADKLAMLLPVIKVTRDVSKLNLGTETEDMDVYYINFTLPGFLNATDEEIETKTVAFKIGSKGNWADAAKEAIDLAFNAKQNLDNELLDVFSDGADTIYIMSKEGGRWRRGTYNNKPNRIIVDNLTMEVFSDPTLTSLPLENNSRVKIYGVAEDVTTTVDGTTAGSDTINNKVDNGKITADLEYFCMGERGDIYRNMGWPNVIYTDYLVDPSKKYDYLDIHFYFQGEGVRDDKSEKLITLVQESGAGILEGFRDTICGTSSSSNSSNGSSTSNEENPEDGNVGTND